MAHIRCVLATGDDNNIYKTHKAQDTIDGPSLRIELWVKCGNWCNPIRLSSTLFLWLSGEIAFHVVLTDWPIYEDSRTALLIYCRRSRLASHMFYATGDNETKTSTERQQKRKKHCFEYLFRKFSVLFPQLSPELCVVRLFVSVFCVRASMCLRNNAASNSECKMI